MQVADCVDLEVVSSREFFQENKVLTFHFCDCYRNRTTTTYIHTRQRRIHASVGVRSAASSQPNRGSIPISRPFVLIRRLYHKIETLHRCFVVIINRPFSCSSYSNRVDGFRVLLRVRNGADRVVPAGWHRAVVVERHRRLVQLR